MPAFDQLLQVLDAFGPQLHNFLGLEDLKLFGHQVFYVTQLFPRRQEVLALALHQRTERWSLVVLLLLGLACHVALFACVLVLVARVILFVKRLPLPLLIPLLILFLLLGLLVVIRRVS